MMVAPALAQQAEGAAAAGKITSEELLAEISHRVARAARPVETAAA